MKTLAKRLLETAEGLEDGGEDMTLRTPGEGGRAISHNKLSGQEAKTNSVTGKRGGEAASNVKVGGMDPNDEVEDESHLELGGK